MIGTDRDRSSTGTLHLLVFPGPEFSNIPEELLAQMVSLTWSAMTQVIPSELSREDSEAMWMSSQKERIRNGSRYLLLLDAELLKGYVAYRMDALSNELIFEDIVIQPCSQGDGKTIFRLLSAFWDQVKREPFERIRTYTNRQNMKMQRLLAKMGFRIVQEKDRGYAMAAERDTLEAWWHHFAK